MSKVISISREFGSGGREIGYRLAKKLGIPFYDKEIISMAAEDSNISEEIFHANDEVIGHKERIDYQYAVIDPFSSTYEVPVYDKLFVIQSRIMEDSFSVFICSSLKKRVERLLSLEQDETVDVKKMEARIRTIDQKRRDYYQYYSGNEWGKPKNYDLCLNSGRLGIQKCVDIVSRMVSLT